MTRYVFAAMLVFTIIPSFAQTREYRLQTRRFSDAVWIRWNPPSQEFFNNDVSTGYSLQRITVSRDGIPLETEERLQLNANSIRWDTAISATDTMSVLKALLFWVPEKTDNFQTILQQKEMKDLAYLQGNLWLLRDFNHALICGLGWVDHAIKNNETYVYELRLWEDTSKLLASHYSILLYDQPRPQLSLKPERGKKTLLRIEKEDQYWGYFIEKAVHIPSEFEALSTLPFINGSQSTQLLITDTQAISKGKVYYRVAGLDVFGLTGPWSDTQSIQVLPDLACPGIENLRMISDTSLTFTWTLPDSILSFIQKAGIRYASAIDEEFKPLVINKTTSGWQARWPEGYSSVYLQPYITDLNDEMHFGPAGFLQPIDSIPPPVPVNLHAFCDSTGVVSIDWQSSPGAEYYRLYRSNYRDAEFADHSHVYFTDTVFSDTLDLNTIRDTVYYAVTALDSRYNESGQSMFACPVFDKIPPPPPAFLGYELTEKGYMIRWTGSRDAASYNLHKLGSDLQTISTDSVFYLDSTGASEEQYTYYLTAKDRNANVSEASAKLVLRFPFKSVIPAVPKPVCLNDTQKHKCYVMWEYPDMPNVSHFRIMLKSPGKSKTIATAQSNERQYCMHGFLKSEADEIEIIVYTKDGMKSR